MTTNPLSFNVKIVPITGRRVLNVDISKNQPNLTVQRVGSFDSVQTFGVVSILIWEVDGGKVSSHVTRHVFAKGFGGRGY